MKRANEVMGALVRNTYRTFDRDYEALAIERGLAGTFSCTKGCAACCDQAVMISLVEAMAIVDKHPRVVADVAAKLREQEDIASQYNLTPAALNIMDPSTGEERQRFLDAWYARRIPCAFLDTGTKLCRIYESRPLACRSHAVSSPAEECDKRPGPGAAPTVAVYDPGVEYSEAMHTLWSKCDQVFGQPVVGFIPSMVLLAYEGIPAPR